MFSSCPRPRLKRELRWKRRAERVELAELAPGLPLEQMAPGRLLELEHWRCWRLALV
jgi:hypothetical protein